jgi:hypothetical protein
VWTKQGEAVRIGVQQFDAAPDGDLVEEIAGRTIGNAIRKQPSDLHDTTWYAVFHRLLTH